MALDMTKRPMVKLSELFDVSYGNKFDMNKMTPLERSNGGVDFEIGRAHL